MHRIPQPTSRNSTTQTVASGVAAAAVTNAFGSQTNAVRIVCNAACHVLVGTTPVATVSDPFLPASFVEYINVNPGEKISAIQAATGGLVTATVGTLWVTELT